MGELDDSILLERRKRVALGLQPMLEDALLLIGAGCPVPLPENSDQVYPFRAHAEFFYLADLEHPGSILAFDPREDPASWQVFVPPVTEAERIWEGRTDVQGTPIDLLGGWLAERAGRPVVLLGLPPAGMPYDLRRTERVREAFKHLRRPKDPAEIDRLRHAAACTAKSYGSVHSLLRAGVTEKELQIELESSFRRAGADGPAYGTIVGSGPNSAILHVPPSQRRLQSGEFVLIDAGAEFRRYVCDVTRTYVVEGRASPFQRDLYDLVLSVQKAAIDRCRPGAEWKDLHLQASLELTAGLVDLGILRGSPESLVEREAHLLFFPHGLGHLVGLGVRDASGLAPGRVKDPRPACQNLRTDLPLQPGYVITVEPGLYFIPALLNDSGRRLRFQDCVDWPAVDSLLALGGVRIEDNVLITAGAPEVLTQAIPKELELR